MRDFQLDIIDIKNLAEFLTQKKKCFDGYEKIYNFLFKSRISEDSKKPKEKGKIKRTSGYTQIIDTVYKLRNSYDHGIKIKIKLIINKLQLIYAKEIFGKNSNIYNEIQTEIKRTERVLENIQAAKQAARDNPMCTYHQYIF